MGISGAAIFGWARLLAPIILGNIPQTKALAPKVGPMMDEAEALKNAKGADKLAHVVNLGLGTGEAINAEKPGTVDMTALSGAMQEGINTAFEIAKIAAAKHGEVDPQPTVVGAAPTLPATTDPPASQS